MSDIRSRFSEFSNLLLFLVSETLREVTGGNIYCVLTDITIGFFHIGILSSAFEMLFILPIIIHHS